jgi:pSer/pThr/pTyr-binding forkhead associated (FHA) protein
MVETETRAKRAVPVPFSAPYVFTLSAVAGPDVTAVHRLNQPVTVLGRAADADCVVDDPEVSGRHCELRVDAGHCFVVDLGSRNGTLVNGRPIEPGVARRLRHLDEIEAGGTRWLLLCGKFTTRT